MSRLIPALPDDISILCIARVPRSHHPFLAVVSRAWRALLRSPLLFYTRIQVGASQPFLFISIGREGPPPKDQYRWYLLDRHLRRNVSSALIPLPTQPHRANHCAAVSLGHSLYLLGGLIGQEASPIVQIYDARFNYWRRGPDMSVSRCRALACVISGRIYVVGGCSRMSEFWVEEFDPEIDRWRQMPGPPMDIRWDNMSGKGAVIGGKLHVEMWSFPCMIFDPAVAEPELVTQAEKAWCMSPKAFIFHWVSAMVDVLYRNNTNTINIKWYHVTNDECRPVEGVDKEIPKLLRGATLADLGQELCLVSEGRWEGEKMEVICAGVRLSIIDTVKVQGSLEWVETCVLPCPRGTSILDCISVEF